MLGDDLSFRKHGTMFLLTAASLYLYRSLMDQLNFSIFLMDFELIWTVQSFMFPLLTNSF
jgi:hypothetical protein